MSTTPRRLDRRPARSAPVILVAVALLAAGTLGIWLFGSLVIDGAVPAWAAGPVDTVGSLRFDSTAVSVVAALLAAVGLLLLMSAVVPGRSAHRPLMADDIAGMTVMSHRDLGRRVQRRLERTDGVHSARVRVSSHRVNAVVLTPLNDPDRVHRRVVEAARHAVAALRPDPEPRIRVRVRRAR